MKKKGLTIVELLIAMVLLAIIMSAVSAIFAVALRNYQVSFTQSGFQKEANLVTDSIIRDTKQAIEIPESHQEIQRSASTIILVLPAVDENENFIYDGGVLERDYIVYSLSGDRLEKTTNASTSSKRYTESSETKTILENVSGLNFIYTPNSPGAETIKAGVTLTLSKTVSKTEINVTVNGSANKRNYE